MPSVSAPEGISMSQIFTLARDLVPFDIRVTVYADDDRVYVELTKGHFTIFQSWDTALLAAGRYPEAHVAYEVGRMVAKIAVAEDA